MVRSKTSSDTFSQDILSISKSKRQKCHVVDQKYKFSENFQKNMLVESRRFKLNANFMEFLWCLSTPVCMYDVLLKFHIPREHS